MPFAIAKTLLLTSTYLFNAFYYKSKIRYMVAYSVILPLLHSIYNNSTLMYLPLRVYSLVIVFLIYATFPEMVEKLNDILLWTSDRFNPLKIISLIAESFVLYNVVKMGTQHTLIECLYA